MDFTLSLKRDDLIKALEEKRVSLEREFEAKLKPYRETKKEEDDTAAAFKKWHLEVATMVRKGEAEFTETGKAVATAKATSDVPPKPPARRRSGRDGYTEARYQIERYEAVRDKFLATIDSNLRLLKLAQDDTVTIGAGEYEKILGLTVESYWR